MTTSGLEALEYARAVAQHHRATYSGEFPGASLVLRCLGLGSLWARHKRVPSGALVRYRTPEGGYISTQERQVVSLLGFRVSCRYGTNDVLPALVLASLIHPNPPEGLLAVAALLIADGAVEVVR